VQNLVLLQALCCFFLTGLIWTVQLVHYPSFVWIQRDKFSDYSDFHSFRISLIVIPFMIAELITAGLLVLTPVPMLTSKTALYANFVGVLLIWASTFILSVPCHTRLNLGFSDKTIHKLVKTNWPRTLIWSARSVFWFTVISQSLIV